MSGVRQGRIPSLLLFIPVIDFVVRRTVIGPNHGIERTRRRVENFTYLGNNISNTGDVEKDVQTRTGKEHLVVKIHHHDHKATPLYVSGHPYSNLRLRDVDKDSQHHQQVGCLPSTVPQIHPEDLMERPPRERPPSVVIEGGQRRHVDKQPRKT
ncbi:Hypothetical predicted protein [Xyrichtys novacula]|uniref:Secreted protein n=1 Tax=Xyrichtys novacula TaxID=13765 RepID=A0AAV1GUG1_XYRNO|nr:Hypothetical predicted protein [Xyrichtys novacula]